MTHRHTLLLTLCLAMAGLLSPALSHANDWVFCAAEGAACNVSGEAVVRFGAEGRYEYKNVAGPILCSPDVFGDPARGEPKTCAYNRSGNAGTWAGNGQRPVAAGNAWGQNVGGWRTCAREDGFCDFRGSQQVRYGANGHYRTRYATNGMDCSNHAFGGDPAPGVPKLCQVADDRRPNAGHNRPNWGDDERGGTWRFCAEEGGTCQVPRQATVRFGTEGRYAYQDNVNQRIPCHTDVFGDPNRGERKRCEYSVDGNSGGGWGRSRRGPDSDRYENWVFCATEGGNCRVPRPTSVRFGADGAYQTIRGVTSGIACTTDEFGDPARGKPKQCEYAR